MILDADPATLAARGRFFVRVASQHRKFRQRDLETLPLFPLTMIMEAEGLLAADMVKRSHTASICSASGQ